SIEINDATEAELDSLKGLGPRLTKKILQEKFIQPFGGWQDFIHRLGFQSTTLIHQLSHQGVTINGQSLNYESTQ
ncbi:MAG: hypothetical protein QM520_03690, partial [Gammaproteobacteria bacterium]|nr:hypothetical protein [Gammaproteobacteria bacterium]